MSNTYNLQLRHGGKTYESRNAATIDIANKLNYDIAKLYQNEAVLFHYQNGGEVDTMILIGLPSDSEDGTTKNYFILDTAQLKEQIENIGGDIEEALADLNTKTKELQTAIETETTARETKDTELEKADSDEKSSREEADIKLEETITLTKEDLMSVIKACGLIYNEKLTEDKVTYQHDYKDEIIGDAETLADAIDKISKFVSQLSNSLKINVSKDSKTIDLNLEEGVLSAEVKVADADGLSTEDSDNNIIGVTSEGIYASCSIVPDASNPNQLIFKTSGYKDGKFKVDAYKTTIKLSPYSGDNGKNTGVTVSVDTNKNIISAELNLSSDVDNILKLEDGEYIVEGRAKNIKYGDSTVAKALKKQSDRLDEIEDSISDVKSVEINGGETATVKTVVTKSSKGDFTVSDNVKLSSDNSIIVSKDGLSANVSASWKESTSTLTISVGDDDTEVDLSSLGFSFLKDAKYDSANEKIVLTFDANGKTKTVEIPVFNLIHDTVVEDTNSINLTMNIVTGNPNVLSAELKVDTKSDNILEVTSNGAYVSKTNITDEVEKETKRAKETEDEIKTSVATLTVKVETVENSVTDEIARAKAAETANKTIADSAVAKAEENAENVKELTSTVNGISDKVTKNVENITDLKTTVSDNKTATDNAISTLKSDITKSIDEVKASVTAEVTRATEKETDLTTSVSNEVTRATEAESTLQGNITTLVEKVDGEINRAKTAEGTLQTNVDVLSNTVANNLTVAKEYTDITKKEILNEVTKETTRATNAEQKNAEAIAVINGLETVDGSIKKSLKDAKEYTDSEIKALTTSIGTDIASAIQTASDDATTKSSKALSDANVYTDTELAKEVTNRTNADDLLRASIGSIKVVKDSTSDLKYNLMVDDKAVSEINIPKDQFLKNVTYDSGNKQLVFTFETTAGTTTTSVDVSDLVDTYTAGSGLKLGNNEFSVVVEEHSEKYLTVTENGLLLSGIDDALASLATSETVKTLSDKIDTINGGKEIDGSFAKGDEDTLTSAKSYVDEKVKELTVKDTELVEAIDAEAKTARTAEKVNSDAIAIINGNEAQEGSIKKSLSDAKSYTDEVANTLVSKVSYTEDKKTFALKTEIPDVSIYETSAHAANTYQPKGNYLTEHQSLDDYLKSEIAANTYATKESMNAALTEKANKTDVDNALSGKLSSEIAGLTYATKTELQDVKDKYATVEYVDKADTSLNSTISANTQKIDNFALTYNSATSELKYTDKNGNATTYQLYSGSLIKSGEFDTKSNSIVLTIETTGVESKITIPVTELLSDVDADIKQNASDIAKINEAIAKLAKQFTVETSDTVKLTKSTVGETDTVTASVRLSSSNKQAIQSSSDGLYVSNDLQDYTCVYGSEGTITAQTAISKLLDASTAINNTVANLSNTVSTNATNIANLQTNVQSQKEEITALKTSVATNAANITTLQTEVQNQKTDLATLEKTVEKNSDSISSMSEKITAIDARVTLTENSITSMTKDITGLQTKIETVEKNITSVSEKVDKVVEEIEGGDIKEMNEAITEIKEKLIGDKNNPVDGSLWAVINSLIDAGTY